MKCEFIHRENADRLIVIYAGWSTDPSFYGHIKLPGWDIAVVYEYNDLDFPATILDSYTTVALFAWSLGVYMASKTFPHNRISLAVAINGTEYPIDDSYGIPADIFKGTAATLNTRNLIKFRRRMCGSHYREAAPLFVEPSDDEIANLRNQLDFIDGLVSAADIKADNTDSPQIRWNRVYVSTADNIFPPVSQINSWKRHRCNPEIVRLEEPHYVDLQRIIASTLPSKENVGKRFHKALNTYDYQATAQRSIAERLTDFPGGVPIAPRKVLEIGAGSGIFTRLFTQRFHPEEIDFVDLYPLPCFSLASEERYFVADAEEWVKEQKTESYDAVVSASALQWFADAEAFFRNVSRILRPGGFLLCSTFVRGNLHEMTTLSPFGLVYRTIDELEEMAGRHFMFAKLEEEELIVRFESPRDTLRHLKETGVGGGISTGRSVKELLQLAPLTLTYRPLYIYAVKQPLTESTTHKQPAAPNADDSPQLPRAHNIGEMKTIPKQLN